MISLTVHHYGSDAAMTLPHLALLTPGVPYPPLSGGTAHIMQALRQLVRFYTIDLYALTSNIEPILWGPLSQYCNTVHACERSRPPLWYPFIPAVRHDYSAELAMTLQHRWAKHPPDIVQLEFTSMSQYARLARRTGAAVVCTAHNVAFLAQSRRAQQERQSIRRLRRWVGAAALWIYELQSLRHCDLIITHSQADATALRRWLTAVPIQYVPSGIDLHSWPVCFDPTIEHTVLFVGNYLHPPNVEGALWLAQKVWPAIRQAHPQARLILAGRTPPPAIAALAAHDIEIPGTVDDLRGIYARSTLVVAPIFWGSGVRIKLLEALACGLPVVTTAIAAEGIKLEHEYNALFAEQPATFAAMILRLLDNRSLRNQLGSAGRAIVEHDYDWRAIGQQLAACYKDARERAQHHAS